METGSTLLYGPPQARILAEPMEHLRPEYPLMWAEYSTSDGSRRVLIVSSRFPLDIADVARAAEEVRRTKLPALFRWKELLSSLDLAYRRHWTVGIVDFSFDLAEIGRAARVMEANKKDYGHGARLARKLLDLLGPGAEKESSRLMEILKNHKRPGS